MRQSCQCSRTLLNAFGSMTVLEALVTTPLRVLAVCRSSARDGPGADAACARLVGLKANRERVPDLSTLRLRRARRLRLWSSEVVSARGGELRQSGPREVVLHKTRRDAELLDAATRVSYEKRRYLLMDEISHERQVCWHTVAGNLSASGYRGNSCKYRVM